jgi:dCTP deaminase
MYLSKPDILARIHEIVECPAPGDAKSWQELQNQTKEAHLELRLGAEAFVTKDQVPRRLSETDQFLSIPPGEFALLTTYEELTIPGNLTAFISIRFRYKILGLVNISGFHVDPLFRGRIVFSVYNVGPGDIVLRYKDPIFMIFFAELKTQLHGTREGEFQNQRHLKTETVISLKAAGLSLTTLERRLTRLEIILMIIGGLFIPLFGLVIGLILRH